MFRAKRDVRAPTRRKERETALVEMVFWLNSRVSRSPTCLPISRPSPPPFPTWLDAHVKQHATRIPRTHKHRTAKQAKTRKTLTNSRQVNKSAPPLLILSPAPRLLPPPAARPRPPTPRPAATATAPAPSSAFASGRVRIRARRRHVALCRYEEERDSVSVPPFAEQNHDQCCRQTFATL